MEDPTGGMWIYLIFFLIPLVRILPRMIKKYKRKNAGLEPEPEPAEKYNEKQFFSREQMAERSRFTDERQLEPEPDSKDGWMKKDDFK